MADEARRARGFSGILALLSFCVALALPVLRGDPTAKLLCLLALSTISAASTFVWVITRRDTANYTSTVHRTYGWILVCAVLAIEYYVGFFSPVSVVLAFGIYHIAQSSDRLHSFALPAAAIGATFLLSLLTALGVIEDRSLFRAVDVEFSSQLFSVIASTTVLVLTLVMARVARASMREAVARAQEAVIVAQQREMQLAEANHQLERALRATVGKPGRYTGVEAGDYRLGLVVGVGAIGEVYEARHVHSGESAAVKLLQADAQARDDLVERFVREAQISSRLHSAHVVRVFRVGKLDDGAPYLAMELLRGRDLAARLRQEGKLSLEALSVLAEHLGSGLSHAHSAGVVHRDLKPLNVFEAETGTQRLWKILDFGISKLSDSASTLTQEAVVGTPGYMSPEQARGAEVDHRSDVFAMAVVLYRALTGQAAFPGDNTPQIMFDVVYKTPARPSSLVRRLPRDIDLVMAMALAKDPDLRFQSAQEFAEAFRRACRNSLGARVRSAANRALARYPWDTNAGPAAPPRPG